MITHILYIYIYRYSSEIAAAKTAWIAARGLYCDTKRLSPCALAFKAMCPKAGSWGELDHPVLLALKRSS